MHAFRKFLAGMVCATACLAAAESRAGALEFKDGDRVVLLGNTLIEREQVSGYWETMLTLHAAGRDVQFRNLGWSGDTVWAESRGIFDPPAEGYRRMIEQIRGFHPTIVFIAYGGNEAFAGEAGLPSFFDQLRVLTKDLSENGARLVFLSPIAHERLTPPLPDPSELNRDLALYSRAIQEFAAERGAIFVDLFQPTFVHADVPEHWTDNGMHLTPRGYCETAKILEAALFDAPAAEPENIEALRKTIVRKNELYFHSWRPQNVTYLFGFRKHEQGQNAKEVAEFAALVAAEEARIAELVLGKDVEQ